MSLICEFLIDNLFIRTEIFEKQPDPFILLFITKDLGPLSGLNTKIEGLPMIKIGDIPVKY